MAISTQIFSPKMSISIPIGYSPISSNSPAKNSQKFDFAEQLHLKLANLAKGEKAMKRWPNERGWDDLEEDGEGDDPSRTPERMCEWMRVAGNRRQFEGFSNAEGIGFDQRQFWANPQNADSCPSNSSGFCSSESVAAGQIQSSHSPSSVAPRQLVISFRECPGGPPFVVKTQPRDLVTFREFRHFFGIPSDQNKRFFFKEFCEDRSAPFQWRVIDDDSTPLPIFQGRISAECRTLSESE